MRSSRRNRGLNPEFTPDPTPPNSESSHFSQDFQIETTLEEEQRLQREEEEERQSVDEERSTLQIESTVLKEMDNDINFSSESLTKSDSDDQSLVVIEQKDNKKSSKQGLTLH